ncbi:ankyrin-1-like [Trichogramma pretiosum]|uniref:ankyrin-1-like n=1 Tax=Trichogramma pretiosum TaxID=7493 RepID=UPI000C719035|nr:ankyrin-1-like [Trichogramma pretiosum]
MSNNESSVSYNNRKYLEVYGYLSKNVTWEIQEDRREFLYQLDAVIENWKGQLPNILDFFRKEVIHWLLLESTTDADEDVSETPGERFINFVARSGYKDAPEMNKHGKPLLRRTTLVHRAARNNRSYALVSDLFKIFDKLDVNYIDEDGLTHLHVACWYGLDTIVEKFLELGQDPNGFSQDMGARYPYPPLYLALSRGNETVAELLLRKGVYLLQASVDGVTPAHMLGKRNYNDAFLETFFEIVEEKHQTLPVNAIDRDGLLPLDYALRGRNKKLMEMLLRNGSNPNLGNKYRDAPLHTICKLCYNIDFGDILEKFFAINDELGNTIQVNAQNIYGHTPLHLLLSVSSNNKKNNDHNYQDDTPSLLVLQNLRKNAVELLLKRGADPNVADKEGFIPLHNISMDLVETFFKINKELNQDLCVNVRNKWYETPLHRALHQNLKNLAELLLRQDADPDFSDNKRQTCLHIICRRDDDDENMAKMLFQICDDKHRSVKVDAQDNEGRTPLHEALDKGNIKLVEILLRRGARPNLADDKKITPLHAICKRKNGDDGLLKRFFEINDELNQLVEVDAKNEEGSTPLHLALSHGCKKMNQLLLQRHADPNLANAEGHTPLHVICQREDDDVDLVKMLFEMSDKLNKPIQIDARDKFGCAPLHLALNGGHEQIAEWLLRRGADINLANVKGSTPLHMISAGKMDYADFLQTFFEISDEQRRPVKVDARDNEGKTPLHHAISHRHKKLFELLLRRDVDPNVADNDGSTALHTICMADDDNGWATMLFEISEERNRQVQIDARGLYNLTPLHLALVKKELREVAELLLRKGAATNLVDSEGSTPLHTVCKYADDDDRVRMLIEISNEENKPVEVDARNKLGRTPLHRALVKGNGQGVRYLLKLGADPNLADMNGFSPLHVIIKHRYDDDKLLKLFFDACKEVDRPVQVDVQDKNGRTPLQWAVANLFLNAVDVLLDQGADLSSFVFPSKSFFVERFRSISEVDERERLWLKLALASKILAIVKRLEKRGYEFNRSQALDIMSLFAEYGLFEKSVDLDKYWYDDEEFVSKSKEIMVIPGLSLHDLIRLKPKEAAKQLKYENYGALAHWIKSSDLSESYREVCARHLCEKLSRGFFWPWALDAFYEVSRCQLPVLCCEMIIENLKNEDLYNICLATLHGKNGKECSKVLKRKVKLSAYAVQEVGRDGKRCVTLFIHKYTKKTAESLALCLGAR